MDLREQYKAHETTPVMKQNGSPPADEMPQQEVAITQKSTAQTGSDRNNVNKTLVNLTNIVNTDLETNSRKLDNITSLLEKIEAAILDASTTDNGSVSVPTTTGESTRRYVEDRLTEKIAQLEAEIIANKAANTEAEKKQESPGSSDEEVRALQSKVEQERARAAQAEARFETAMRELDEANAERARALEDLYQIDNKWVSHFEESLVAHESIEESLKESIDREQDRRRRLFEQVQDLKGSIRVMCRIRPAPRWVEEDELMNFGAPTPGEFSDNWGRLNVQATRKAATGPVLETKTFDFERVFGPEDTNEAVFDEISELVQSSMEGKKVTLFAYGQTGSGKTHTMLGTDEDPGIIPKTIEMMFDVSGESPDYRYSVAMSIIEVYQDSIHDLLVEPENGKKARVRLSEAARAGVGSRAAALEILARASQYRTVAATNANEQSSRSHLILSFQITKEYLAGSRSGQTATGTLNLVDLAGSERTAAAGATGTQMREGVSINSDLMNLNLVITALGNGTRVPYDSALTKALKSSLEKGSRTLMFVMVSPFKKDQSQTVQTLEKGAEATKAKLASLTRANNFAKKPAAAASSSASPASGSGKATPVKNGGPLAKARNSSSSSSSPRPTPARKSVGTPCSSSSTGIPRPASSGKKSTTAGRLSSGTARTAR